jgi:hypothetical protein
MDLVTCDSCGNRFPVDGLTAEKRCALQDQHYRDEFAEELRMLEKVKALYARYPEAKGRIKPHCLSVLDLDDPQVMEIIRSGVPFDRIPLPPPEPIPSNWTADTDDAEAVEYLRHNSFLLDPRMESIRESMAKLKSSLGTVECPACQVGRLHVERENWDAFANAVYPSMTCYWPDWHGIDDDGTLHVKSSGWAAGCHWTGERSIVPSDPDYAFWRWLVVQKEHHRVVDETEIPSIRENWRRSSGSDL